MKKSKRLRLNLECLETRVVPSHSQVVIDPDHASAAVAAMTTEIETPKVETEVRDATESDAGQIKKISDDMTLATSENTEHHDQAVTENQSDSDHAVLTTTTSDNQSETDVVSASSSAVSTPVESAESQVTGSVKTNVSNKANLDTDSAKSKAPTVSDRDNVKLNDSTGNTSVSVTSTNASKANSDNDSAGNANTSKSQSSSDGNSSSKSENSSNSSTRADNDSTNAASTVSRVEGATTASTPVNRVLNGKSQADHKDTSGSSSSTETGSVSRNALNGTSTEGMADPVNSAETRAASTTLESNSAKSSGELSGSKVAGLSLGVDPATASISGTAAALSAKVAVGQLPAVVDVAIPLTLPALDSMASVLGLGELAAMDSLAPVAGDLIVGFLPVEQASLASAMQSVLDQIDSLGEQIVGSSGGKWLYPIVFTALAAATVFQLASRRRRQFRPQSVWARESGIWSPTCLGSSWQE